MVRINFFLVTTFTAALMAAVAFSSSPSAATKATVAADYGKLPLIFEANRGQTDAQVKFLSRGPGYSLYLTESEAVLSLRAAEGKGHALRVKLLGAEAEPEMTGLDRLPGVSNYFLGNDPKKWRRGVPHYAKVDYEGVYPGIDLVFYGTGQRQLEYDFVVAPGADPGAIGLGFEGAERLEIDGDGDLIAHLPGGEVRFLKPVIYQEADGAKQPVAGGYALKDGRVTFDLAAYDHARPLVIDPVLAYATYLGGSNTEQYNRTIAIDSEGNAYVAGQTRSDDFPVVNAYDSRCEPPEGDEFCSSAFVAKLDSTGSFLHYATYLGDSSIALGIAVYADEFGDDYAYVVGGAGPDFPTTVGAYTRPNGGGSRFFTILTPNGDNLAYSTNSMGGGHIAVDGGGRAYIVSSNGSGDFPTTIGAFDTICGDDIEPGPCNNLYKDASLAVIDPSGMGQDDLVYATYLGGSSDEDGVGIAVDDMGLAYVAGYTASNDFPVTPGAFDEDCGTDGVPDDCINDGASHDAFVAVIDPSGMGQDDLVYATYLGGKGGDLGRGVALPPGCESPCPFYVTGDTYSSDFPTTSGAIVPYYVAGGFVSVIDPADGNTDPANDLVYSTFFGGRSSLAIAVGGGGEAYITGLAGIIPTSNPIQDTNAGSGDAFVAVIDPANGWPEGLLFSTYLGGSATDGGYDLAVDSFDDAYVVGITRSSDFPTTEWAFQTEISIKRLPRSKQRDLPPPDPEAFVVKIEDLFSGVEDPVNPLEPWPIARDDSYGMNEDGTLDVDPLLGVLENDEDPAGGGLRASVRDAPSNGTVQLSEDGSFTYTPDADFNGADSFQYRAIDFTNKSDVATVRISVNPIDDPPVAVDDRYLMNGATNLSLFVDSPGVLENDRNLDGGLLALNLIEDPKNGTAVLSSDGSFTYTQNSGFIGTDGFTYEVVDGNGDVSNIATVTIVVLDGTMHVGDFDGTSYETGRKTWSAYVIATIHLGDEGPIEDATGQVEWRDNRGDTGTKSCRSNIRGECALGLALGKSVSQVTFTFTDVTDALNILTYEPTDNHDPDGDSDGTSITVFRP
jgi:hypothetical protein